MFLPSPACHRLSCIHSLWYNQSPILVVIFFTITQEAFYSHMLKPGSSVTSLNVQFSLYNLLAPLQVSSSVLQWFQTHSLPLAPALFLTHEVFCLAFEKINVFSIFYFCIAFDLALLFSRQCMKVGNDSTALSINAMA